MLKIILSNGLEIEVCDGSTIFDLQVNPDQYGTIWGVFTDDNLKLVKLASESGDILDQLSDLTMDHEYSVKEKDVIICHFYLREKTATEIELKKLRDMVASLQEEVSIQDGAIMDLGDAVSGLADEGRIV